MYKFIAAFDGLQFSESALQYSLELTKKSKAQLIGVFLDDPSYHSYSIYELVAEKGVSTEKMKQLQQKDNLLRKKSAEHFFKSCQQEGIGFSTHHDRKIAIHDLLHESIFSDLLIIDYQTKLTKHESGHPSVFIRELLSDTQCPVLLVPPAYQAIQKITLLYDGETSSVYAIKMFDYILSALKDIPIELICTKPPGSNLHLPDHHFIKELTNRHFGNLEVVILKGLAETEVVSHLQASKINALVVMGAYRRSMLSRWFHSSLADVLMHELKMPLFIAHNKS